MNARTTEHLTLKINTGTAHLSMRGKTIAVTSRHGFTFQNESGENLTIESEIGQTKDASVSWPLTQNKSDSIWSALFKETPDARN